MSSELLAGYSAYTATEFVVGELIATGHDVLPDTGSITISTNSFTWVGMTV